MAKQTIYTVGGTVQAGGGLYIKRKADDELLELCRQGEFAFILSSRQVGKSSLMVRTAQQLEKENINSVTIDLSAIGVNVTQDEWYLGILNEIQTALNLKTNIFAWWNQYTQLGQAQRLTNFFKDVLLKEVQEQIVLFFDEIDSTLSIPFSDDFYIAIRSVYNARSTNPDFKRLSFVLVGVATPADLISDNRRTPFNIGHRVEINDFTVSEALPLAQGLGPQATQVLTWILQYTGGHPYLTQRLCAYLASSKDALDEQAVSNAVERLFTGEQGKQDNNLQFVRDMLSARSPDVTRVLKTYKDIRSGKIVPDDERSLTKAHLKLSGLVRSEKGVLRVRNEIYSSVFDLQWVQENTPKNWQKAALISLSASLGILMVVALGIFINDFFVGTKVNESIARFISTTSSVDRLASLAEIYNQKGILSNTDASLQAAQLFYGLSSSRDQLELFRVYGIEQSPALQDDLVIVISHLYVTVADVDPEVDNTELLQTMQEALSHIPHNPEATQVRDEITAWIAGRNQLRSGDYAAALGSYGDALSLNPNNHATLYERAKVYVAREQYTDSLNDLDAVIAVAEQSAPVIPPTATPTASSMPASATPDLIQTRISGAGSTSLPLTGVPLDGSETPAGILTATATPAQAPLVTPQLTDIPRVERYESNFTTLIDVINAVRTLIESTPGLQAVVQQNGESAYSNLQSFGLAGDFPTQPPTLEPALSQVALITRTSQPTTINTTTPLPLPTLEEENLLAYYTLNGTNKESTGNYTPINLVNAPFVNEGVYCNGIYIHSGENVADYCLIETPPILDFNYQDFTISVDFNVSQYPQYDNMPVIIGGSSHRWIGAHLNSRGEVGILYNNQNREDCGGQYNLDTWHNIISTYDGKTGKLLLDNNLLCEIAFSINTGGGERDKKILTTNYSNGTTFKGYIRNLKIYKAAIAP